MKREVLSNILIISLCLSTTYSQKSKYLKHYGVHLIFEENVRIVTDYWKQYYTVSLGDPQTSKYFPDLKYGCLPHVNKTDCNIYRKHLDLIEEIGNEYNIVVSKVLKNIREIFPDEATVKPKSNMTIRRLQRSPLDFIGDASSFLFGTATTKQLDNIKIGLRKTMEKLINESHGQINEIHDLMTLTKVINNRVENSMKIEKDTREYLQSLYVFSEHNHEGMAQIIYAISKRLYNVFKGRLLILNHYIAIQNFMAGKLDPAIINPFTLTESINFINKALDNKYNQTFFLIPQSKEYIYKQTDAIAIRKNNTLIIIKNFPLSAWNQGFNIFRVETFQIPITGNNSFNTYVKNLPKFVAISEDETLCIEFMNDPPILNKQLFELSHNKVRLFNTTCLFALINNILEVIKYKCQMYFVKSNNYSLLNHINDNEILLINIPSYTLHCQNKEKIKYDGCVHCIKQLPCGCNMYSNENFIPGRISNCVDNENNSYNFYSPNIIFLHHFFDKEELLPLLDGEYQGFEINISLPKFNFVKSESNDSLFETELKKVSDKIKNSEKLYEDPFREFKDFYIENTDDWLLSDNFSWTKFIMWSGLICSHVSLVLCVTLMWKLNTNVAMMAHFGMTAAYQVSPISNFELKYKVKTTESPRVTFREDLYYYVANNYVEYIQIIVLILIATSLILVGKRFYYITSYSYVKFGTRVCLNLSNGINKITLIMVELPDSYENYLFKGNPIDWNFRIEGFYCPKLFLLGRGSIEHKDILGTNMLPFIIRIPFIARFKLKKILKSKFYSIPFIITHEGRCKSIKWESIVEDIYRAQNFRAMNGQENPLFINQLDMSQICNEPKCINNRVNYSNVESILRFQK